MDYIAYHKENDAMLFELCRGINHCGEKSYYDKLQNIVGYELLADDRALYTAIHAVCVNTQLSERTTRQEARKVLRGVTKHGHYYTKAVVEMDLGIVDLDAEPWVMSLRSRVISGS